MRMNFFHCNLFHDTLNDVHGINTKLYDCAASSEGRCIREVVLLTDDRNLRVKALAADMPARDLRAFLRWAALPTVVS